MYRVRFEETDSLGSFAALGIGFLYEYNARLKALQVSRAGSSLPLIFLEFDGLLAKDPTEIVRIFDKTTQVKALKFSNNTTINLAETLDDSKLPSLLEHVLYITMVADTLRHEQFQDFEDRFAVKYGFKRMDIRRSEGHGTPFYLAAAETQKRNALAARSSTLHGLMTYMSDKIIEDVIAKEFAYNADSWVQKLLNAASILSTLSLVLNERFEPSRKMTGKASSLLSRLTAMSKIQVNSTA